MTTAYDEICTNCSHPWRLHTQGGMCAADWNVCYCSLIPPMETETPPRAFDPDGIRDRGMHGPKAFALDHFTLLIDQVYQDGMTTHEITQAVKGWL